ncbi:uncharacterized protein I303_107884 [Kwoniella dejecticola CBS 10117]|uniref:AB hydrolase-1 domain-containing protein n=1 Tax=Kwoniella dejecticola CBS 10117 TaxID=1296121 RepID=A0AAJ8KXF1_9TREE
MSSTRLLERAQYIPAAIILAYALVLGLLTIPAIQRELLFLHHVPIPLFADFHHPEKYGLAPFKTRNLRLNTSDGVELGAWHILSRSSYQSLDPLPPLSPLDDRIFEKALSERPNILYFHGNAGTRAISHRVRSYSSFSNTLDCNVLAVDYRGFGDSSGTPSEEGLLEDARTAFDFVAGILGKAGLSKDEIQDQIILAGQSLGTGVVSGLAGRLALEGIFPRALVLIAPFTSITDLLVSYRLFRFVPILGPLAVFPSIQRYFQTHLHHPFDSVKALENTSSSTLILHAVNDNTIPFSHSAKIFSSLRSTINPSVTVEETIYPGWGTVRTFGRVEKGEVIWWEGQYGGHDNLGWAEGTTDLIARIARL